MNLIRVRVVLLATVAVLGITVWLAVCHRPSPSSPTGERTPPPNTGRLEGSGTNSVSVPVSSPSPPAPAPAALNPDNVESILAALESPDKETRTAAIENAKQIEDRSVAPRLTEAAERLGDPEEKAALLAAVDFINLPSVVELQEAQRSNRLALGLSPPGRAMINRYTGKPFRGTRDSQTAPIPSQERSNPSQ